MINPHNNFKYWLVFDWKNGTTESKWLLPHERSAEAFLHVTPDGRRWFSDAASLSLPEVGFVLVVFLRLIALDDALDERTLNVANFPGSGEGDLPIWCHYGGEFDPGRVGERWHAFTWLSRSLRDQLTRRLPAPFVYPTPISDSQPPTWNRDWHEAREAVRFFEPSKWDDLIGKLNRTWESAIESLHKETALVARSEWANVASVFEILQSHLPAEGAALDDECLRVFLREATSLQLDLLAPRDGSGKLDAFLSATFTAALDGINALSADLVKAEPTLVEKHVKTIRESLCKFLFEYDKE